MRLVLFLFSSIAFVCSSAFSSEKKINLAPPKVEAKAPAEVMVKESTVLLHGKLFRRIEYRDETFYFRIQSKIPKSDPEKVEPSESVDTRFSARKDCLKTNLPFPEENARVIGEVKFTASTSVYIEALHNQCESFDPRVQSDGGIGLKLNAGEESDLRIGIESTPTGVTPKTNFNLNF